MHILITLVHPEVMLKSIKAIPGTQLVMENNKHFVQQIFLELWALMYNVVEIKLIIIVFKFKQPCSSST